MNPVPTPFSNQPGNKPRFWVLLITVLVTLGAAVVAISYLAPLPIPYFQDFSVMYFTDKGLLNDIPIYDYPAQLVFVKALTSPKFTFFPYPYPPWYALSTLYIGMLPIQVAARAWFLINIGMISLSVWLLTPGWKGTWRILAAFAAIMFIPAFGLLMVGQYSAPVLLGSALFVFASRRKSAWLTALGFVLMTFKPHVGGILLLAGMAWLVVEAGPGLFRGQGSPFAQRALWLTIAAGLFLAVIGFVADPAWPLNWYQSLGRYREIPGVQTCGLCSSLPVALLKLLTGQESTFASVWLSIFLVAGLALVLFWRYRSRKMDAALFMSLSAVITLLIDPYLLNYDYILLILPLLWLVRQSRLVWLPYFVPWLLLALGRSGNVLLVISGIVTFILILRRPIDSPAGEAYNDPDLYTGSIPN